MYCILCTKEITGDECEVILPSSEPSKSKYKVEVPLSGWDCAMNLLFGVAHSIKGNIKM